MDEHVRFAFLLIYIPCFHARISEKLNNNYIPTGVYLSLHILNCIESHFYLPNTKMSNSL